MTNCWSYTAGNAFGKKIIYFIYFHLIKHDLIVREFHREKNNKKAKKEKCTR